MGEDDGLAWRERQRRAVRAHAEADGRRRAAEQAGAAQIVAWFVAEATRRRLPTTRLHARSYDGRGRYRTRLTGWYVDRARTRAVDTAGRWYLLTVPASLRALVLGADPPPSPAPLIVGEGGRDGESIPLRDLLARLLDEGAGPG
ncbi:hypothetical protein E1258_02715 [Micromonospora sp. KC207]|uniref:hypothetical protein n=1 Tax=Micromonospora sp. KC207 TaxID=2530377 RepID=UPI00104A1D49|nr:hypothetical protein [Micromonospora sp. KC207]TDC66495.1 hypothetical protein E1258_02715 [Micromonospora sp. KC207]